MSQFQEYLSENKQRFEDDLCDWLRIASISTDSQYSGDVRAAADWLADRFRALEMTTEIIETCGHPIVYAETPAIEGAPTVLVYGHYDVQPPDPLDLWTTPPFEPTVRDGKLYARGATDDKGQMITHLFSAEAWIKTMGKLPVQLKFVVEGEEECGSEGFNEFMAGKYDKETSVKDKLAADICVISDCSQFAPGQPAITYGLRGISYFEVVLTGPNRDLHSGAFGGSVTNPANALAKMLSALIDENGKVQVPGFYDGVPESTEREQEQFKALNFSDEEYMAELGVNGLTGEEGYSTIERRWTRPTFDVNGLWSGYQGEGRKTVLPSIAGAKFSFRTIPGQNIDAISGNLQKMLEDMCPPGITMKMTDFDGAAPGCVVPLESPYMEAAAVAIESGFGSKPVFIRSGGSIPLVNSFSDHLGIDTLLLGWGQDDDNPHSPDEKFSLEDFHRGIASSAHLWGEVAKISK